MKKVLFPILALVLALGLAVPVAAHTESDPFVTDLIADGGSVATKIDVGDVSVWNDSTTLYVKYETTGGWEITKTHLAVATEESGIPQNRAGNPKVGQFPHSTSHAPPVTDFTYTIPLSSWAAGSTLCIAAHAKVEKLSDVMTTTLVSDDLADDVLVISENTSNPGYPLGYPGPYSGTVTPSVLTWKHGSWPLIAGAQWISSAYWVEDPVNDSWRLFTRSFSVPSNATNLSGTLQITADNAEEVELNSSPVGLDGEVYGPFTDNQEWNTILSHSVSPQPGNNTLEVMMRNYAMPSGTVTSNPAGLIYKMDYEYQLLTTETAWGDGTRFTEPGNWAMYFTYHVQGLPGNWLLDVNYQGTHYLHDMTITTQSSDGTLSGTGGWPTGSGPPYSYPYNWTLTGNISGSTVNFTIFYQNGYTASFSGTVSAGGTAMSGTWTGPGQTGTWSATRGPIVHSLM